MGPALVVASRKHPWRLVWYRDGQALVEVEASLKGTLWGLCGRYSGDPEDDKILPDGRLVDSTQEFGDAWAVPGAEQCGEKAPPSPVANCSQPDIQAAKEFCEGATT